MRASHPSAPRVHATTQAWARVSSVSVRSRIFCHCCRAYVFCVLAEDGDLDEVLMVRLLRALGCHPCRPRARASVGRAEM